LNFAKQIVYKLQILTKNRKSCYKEKVRVFEFYKYTNSIYSKKTQKNTKINSQLIRVKYSRTKFVLNKKLFC